MIRRFLYDRTPNIMSDWMRMSGPPIVVTNGRVDGPPKVGIDGRVGEAP